MKMNKTDLRNFLTELVEDSAETPAKSHSVSQRIWKFLCQCLACAMLSVVVLGIYTKYGHDRGWPRAEQWHQYLLHYHLVSDLAPK